MAALHWVVDEFAGSGNTTAVAAAERLADRAGDDVAAVADTYPEVFVRAAPTRAECRGKLGADLPEGARDQHPRHLAESPVARAMIAVAYIRHKRVHVGSDALAAR